MIEFDTVLLCQEPYTFATASDVLDPERYSKLVETFPPEALFSKMNGGGYNKLSLSERNNKEAYRRYVGTAEEWWTFYEHVKSKVFVLNAMEALDVRLPGKFSSRFEFSSMPAAGGFICPHTDITSKVITLVIPMYDAGEWEQSWGGGTDILKPADPMKKLLDYKAPLNEFEKVRTIPFLRNQCLIFLKTENSWHSVGPIQGPVGKWRRSVTINIERV